MLWSECDRKGLAVDLYSNTGRNPANAQFKRQKLYTNILPRINGPQIYQRRVTVDDWESRPGAGRLPCGHGKSECTGCSWRARKCG